MKVLVLQLARLGDIFQTWPTFRAMERAGQEVQVLARTRFLEALTGLSAVKKVHAFDTKQLLEPLLTGVENGSNGVGLITSLHRFDLLMETLRAERFDRVVNLSFSPLASWIAFELQNRAEHAIEVLGYTRQTDGFLAIPDDASAYFYAQVGSRVAEGCEPCNRLPLPRLLGTIAKVDVEAGDWRGPDRVIEFQWQAIAGEGSDSRGKKLFALHIGASQENKTLDAESWARVALGIVRRLGARVVLLGAKSETTKADRILEQVAAAGVKAGIKSLVGETTVREVFEVLGKVEALVAGDSALVHIASLVGTKVLNLSSRSVNHWETGPATSGSRILVYGGASPAVEPILDELHWMMEEQPMTRADRTVTGPIEAVVQKTPDSRADLLWRITAALYLSEEFPTAPDAAFLEAVEKWRELNSIERTQLEFLRESLSATAPGSQETKQSAMILDQVDEVLNVLIAHETRLAPVARWRATEKLRWGPADPLRLVEQYQQLNEQVELVLSMWQSTSETATDSLTSEAGLTGEV